MNDTSFCFDPGEALIETLKPVGQFAMIDSQTMQDGGIQISDVNRIFLNIVTEIVS